MSESQTVLSVGTSGGLVPPPVYWSQNSAAVQLRIDVQDARGVNINITKDTVHFSCTAPPVAEKTERHYAFSLSLLHSVDVTVRTLGFLVESSRGI